VSVRRAAIAFAIVAACATAARAQDLRDRFNAKLSLTGLYVGEHQDLANRALNEASSTLSLGWGDLRAILDARRLPGKFDLHIDARLRATGDFDRERAYEGASQVTARGYLGGREYDLRELYAIRRGESVDFSFGRFYVVEADGLKLDGLRLVGRFGKRHWEAGAFVGGYPNPYSRSLTTDYQGAKGYYGAQVAGGASIAYTYDRYWGSLAAVGSYLGGNDDGGPINPMAPAGRTAIEGTRSFLVWNGFERFVSWLDLYHSLVLDVAGPAGVQLTRLDALATVRAGRFVTIRAGYDHLAPIAIEMQLLALLNSRANFVASTVENNLIVQRTARDSGRLELSVAWEKLRVFGEGRVRYRSLVNGAEQPQLVRPNGDVIGPQLGWDATVGLRDGGSLKGLRMGVSYIYLDDYRAASHVVSFELGRSFLDERLTLDLNVLYARTRDKGISTMPCNTFAAPLELNCYGMRDGASYETALTLTGAPGRRWFLLGDYRLVINQSEIAGGGMVQGRPLLFTHVLLLRVEARF
jgi:hypothetical protein